MKVRIRLFAAARQAVGRDHAEVDVPEQATIADARRCLADAFPALAPLMPSLVFAIGTRYAGDASAIPSDAVVACIPPVSGG